MYAYRGIAHIQNSYRSFLLCKMNTLWINMWALLYDWIITDQNTFGLMVISPNFENSPPWGNLVNVKMSHINDGYFWICSKQIFWPVITMYWVNPQFSTSLPMWFLNGLHHEYVTDISEPIIIIWPWKYGIWKFHSRQYFLYTLFDWSSYQFRFTNQQVVLIRV